MRGRTCSRAGSACSRRPPARRGTGWIGHADSGPAWAAGWSSSTPLRTTRRCALTSHLPHALAAALVASVPGETLPLAAGAFRDGTRVAGSDAALWAGIFLENRGPLLRALDRFETQLGLFRQALEARDESTIRSWWEAARARRGEFEAENAARGIED